MLDGGLGADFLDGGSGTDRAQYYNSKQGLTVDLGNSSANTGIAAGDTFSSIEDLAGSPFDDQLSGNTGDNRLIGNAGDDQINGAAGNDTLIAGAGDDRLIGGTGDDQLIGGAGADVFVFNAGFQSDTIQDFAADQDRIELNTGLLGATAPDGAAVLADYASLSGTTATLDFGGGDSLSIQGVTALSDLTDVFLFV